MEEETRPNPRNGWRPQLYYRLDLERLAEALGISSSNGISDRPSSTSNSDSSSLTDTTVSLSESATNDSSNGSVITERANTESTSESSAKSLQRVAAGESALQAAENQEFPAIGEEQIEEGTKRNTDHLPKHPRRPSPRASGGGGPSDKPPARPDALDLSRINKLLTERKRYPQCYGVSRAYREDKLTFERLVEAVCYELTGSYEAADRYREAVEGIDRLLREEEGLV
jgi:hypothetical protein